MPKPVAETGNKNLIGTNLIALRKKHHLSQRALAHELQLKGRNFAFKKKDILFTNVYKVKQGILIRNKKLQFFYA